MERKTLNDKLILLTNDDGHFAPGLKALEKEISELAETMTVAPDREQSAASHSLTLQRPLRINKLAENRYSVDGTPTDAVMIAVHALLKGRQPDLLISGINRGPNMGDDITYSGTVAAAIEGSIIGIPSIAVSLTDWDTDNYLPAASAVRKIVRQLWDWPFPDCNLLNINIPYLGSDKYKGAKITKLGKRVYNDIIVEKTDPRGKRYYWIGGEPEWFEVDGSDYSAVNAGYISITPIGIDMTSRKTYENFSHLNLHI
jgi:5'-nucleotidase